MIPSRKAPRILPNPPNLNAGISALKKTATPPTALPIKPIQNRILMMTGVIIFSKLRKFLILNFIIASIMLNLNAYEPFLFYHTLIQVQIEQKPEMKVGWENKITVMDDKPLTLPLLEDVYYSN
jgi:hypothetical protein